MRRFIAATFVMLGLSGCAEMEPVPAPPLDAQLTQATTRGTPTSLMPDLPIKSPRVVAVRADPRVKYTTSPKCHYINYDGSCKFKKYPSYRIQ